LTLLQVCKLLKKTCVVRCMLTCYAFIQSDQIDWKW